MASESNVSYVVQYGTHTNKIIYLKQIKMRENR